MSVAGRDQGSAVEPSIAAGWIIAASTTAALVLLLLVGSAVSGSALVAWAGAFASTQLVWFSQVQFLETHRRRYHRWSSTLGLSTSFSPERHEQWEALRHRDPVRSVEISRLFGIVLSRSAIVSLLAFFGAATAIR